MGGCPVKYQGLSLPLCKWHKPCSRVSTFHGASGTPETLTGDSRCPAIAHLDLDITEIPGGKCNSKAAHCYKIHRIKAKNRPKKPSGDYLCVFKRCSCWFNIHLEASNIAVYLSCSFWVSSLTLCSLLQAIDTIKKDLFMALSYYTRRRGDFRGQACAKDERSWTQSRESGRQFPHPLSTARVRQLPGLPCLFESVKVSQKEIVTSPFSGREAWWNSLKTGPLPPLQPGLTQANANESWPSQRSEGRLPAALEKTCKECYFISGILGKEGQREGSWAGRGWRERECIWMLTAIKLKQRERLGGNQYEWWAY